VRVPRGLTGALVAVALVIALVPAGPAQAGPAGGLCVMNTSRGAVPASFPIEACIDSTGVVLHNQLSVPVHMATTGSVSAPILAYASLDVAATITRLRYSDPLELMPGDTIRIPVGTGTATITLKDTDAGGWYVLAKTLATFIPAGAKADVLKAAANLTDKLDNDFTEYANCLSSNNWIGQIGCNVTLQASVQADFAFGGLVILLAVLKGGVASIIRLLVSAKTFTDFTGQQVPDVETILHGARVITISKPATGASGGSGGSTPPACPGASVFLAIAKASFAANHVETLAFVKGPKCVGSFAAAEAYLTLQTEPPGYEVMVLQYVNGAWKLIRNEGIGHRDEAPVASVCSGLPADLVAWIHCE
jgi:hypothetical protein